MREFKFCFGSLRERYWILNARRTIRSVLSKCVRCRRYESKRLESISTSLPEDRVRDASAFEIIGVDLGGPLYLKNGEKAWFVLVTCAVYRAVHLELITSLSTEAFIQSFRRVIARRGRPSIVYSDNGTNFQGTENLFKYLNWSEIERFASVRRIQWKFYPPSAAWWGGWWERIVRMVKNLLRRVLGRTTLDYEELFTILCDCEATINSRPLTYVSEENQDLVPLTPAMFIQDIHDIGVADMDQIDSTSLNKRHQHRQNLRSTLRRRFRDEYLSQLVQRGGEKARIRPFNIGDVVLVGSDNVKRLNWPMAKIVELYPGNDGKVRVVRVKTSSGDLTRPIQRIYPLEVSSQDETISVKKVKVRVKDTVPNVEESTAQTKSGRLVKKPVRLTC